MGILDNMMGSGKRQHLFGGVDTVLGEHARFKGELASTGSVNISGEFEGKVKSEGEIIVSETGKVIGEVLGGTVVVSGRVDGNIFAKDTLEIAKSGRVHGDLTGGRIIIEEGSIYHGRVKVESGPVSETLPGAVPPAAGEAGEAAEQNGPVQPFPNF